MWIVLLYPLWGLFYWAYRASKDVFECYGKNGCNCNCNMGGGGGGDIVGCIIALVMIMVLMVILTPVFIYFTFAYVFGLFYVLICPCIFSNKK